MYRLVLREADFLDITRSSDIEWSYILVYYGIIGYFVMDVFPEVIDCPLNSRQCNENTYRIEGDIPYS